MFIISTLRIASHCSRIQAEIESGGEKCGEGRVFGKRRVCSSNRAFSFRLSAGTCLPRSVKVLRELESSPSDRNNGGDGNEEGLL